MFTRSRWFLGILLVGAALCASRAEAQTVTVITACKNNVNGNVRIVASASDCRVPETAVQWNQQGPPGPPGTAADPPCFSNTKRYTDCGNGTVTDSVTGLIWLKQAVCWPSPTDWEAATALAAALKSGNCGLTDHSGPGQWRLPTIAEWQATVGNAGVYCNTGTTPTLFDDVGTGCYFDGTNSSLIGVPVGFFWSSSVADGTHAWAESLQVGFSFSFLNKATSTGTPPCIPGFPCLPITLPVLTWPVRRVP
jgi:hypothetical protein